MQTLRWRLIGIGLGLLMLTPVAYAQVDLVVKLQPNAEPTLQTALAGSATQGFVAALPGKTGALLAGVQSIKAVFPRTLIGKQSNGFEYVYTLSAPDSATYQTLLARWKARPDVAYAQPNYRYRIDGLDDTYNDVYFDSLSYIDVIRARDAWTITTGSRNVRVGFIDTGAFFEHPDLAGQFWVNPGEDLNNNGTVDASDFDGIDTDGNGYVDDLRGYDFVDWNKAIEIGDYQTPDPDASADNHPTRFAASGHGMLIAGVMGAGLNNEIGMAGIAPGTQLVNLRAFAGTGTSEDDDVVAAIVYAAEMGLDVVNLSFGDSYYSPLMHDAIRYANARGVVLVASAGNDGSSAPHYPSDYPEVIAVGWLNQDGDGPGSFASDGVGVDLGAPGSFVFTTLLPRPEPDGTPVLADSALYGRRSGSSLSAPMVSAAAALLRSVNPDLSPEAIRGILTSTAIDLRNQGSRRFMGSGRLDVAAALGLPFPARVEIQKPVANGGVTGGTVEIIGSVVTPLLRSFALSYAQGDEDREAQWIDITDPQQAQVRDGVLGTWDTSNLPDSVYVLCLTVELNTGQMLEDRRRVYLDGTPPVVDLVVLDRALDEGQWGIMTETATDDVVDVTLEVRQNDTLIPVASDRRGRRHGAMWHDTRGLGGTFEARVVAVNVAGLHTETPWQSYTLPSRIDNPFAFTDQRLNVPAGYLMNKAVDFDRDGLQEIAFNRFKDGTISDSLLFFEWAGEDFTGFAAIEATLIPRDADDVEGDGKPEFLMQGDALTALLEFDRNQGFNLVYIDTTGLIKRDTVDQVWGTRVADLDQDGRAEIIAHNLKQWRILEKNGDTFTEIARLVNPTDSTEAFSSELGAGDVNRPAAQPKALIEDFDGDGQTDLVVGDLDGDWTLYETRGNNTFEAVWSYSTPRYNNNQSRYTSGDFDGDGQPEFWTYTGNWTSRRQDREYEPGYGLIFYWDSPANDTYVLVDSLVLAGNISGQGSLAAADFDGDGIDELIVAHAPDLYVLKNGPAGWQPIFHQGQNKGFSMILSIGMATADFDADGTPELIASGADGYMHRFSWSAVDAGLPPPQWVEAFAIDAGQVQLRWQTAGADSVIVFRDTPGQDFDRLIGTSEEIYIDTVSDVHKYGLQAWYGGQPSNLSEARAIRPHAPATVAEVLYLPDGIQVRFTEPLHPQTRADQFQLVGGEAPESLLLVEDGFLAHLRFDPLLEGAALLTWSGVRDAEGTPLGDTSVMLDAPTQAGNTLILAAWEVLDGETALLTFNAPLLESAATNPANYRIEPAGQVAGVTFNPSAPTQVQVRIADRALGATGLQTSIIIVDMQGASGAQLAAEGTVATLSAFAETLDDVYVFPNPYEAARHQDRMTIAGLPRQATVRIFSMQGLLVRRLEEADGNGGTDWDLRDESGQSVPSGVYLVQVEAEGLESVIRKAAVVR